MDYINIHMSCIIKPQGEKSKQSLLQLSIQIVYDQSSKHHFYKQPLHNVDDPNKTRGPVSIITSYDMQCNVQPHNCNGSMSSLVNLCNVERPVSIYVPLKWDDLHKEEPLMHESS